VDTVTPAATAKKVSLQVCNECDDDLISGDPARLQQVFWNLLSNAVKFTPRGGEVKVRVRCVGSEIELTVSDTGEGISAEFLPHVFDRFRQADGSSTRKHGGLGLGLAIVKQLVELHGGIVRVQSDGPGEGSVFTVTLPTLVEPMDGGLDVVQKGQSDGRPNAMGGYSDLSGARVLVVDDEADAREFLKRLLSGCGAEVTLAGSAGEAIDALLRSPATVLVSDIGMPGEDGYSLIRRVRLLDDAVRRMIPAIAVTAYARAEDRDRALQAGFQEHLAKPVDPQMLVAHIARLSNAASQSDWSQ